MSRRALALAACFAVLLSGCTGRIGEREVPAPSHRAGRLIVDGSSVGNGGDDLLPHSESAWFLGARTIRYCLEISPDFGVSRETAEADLAFAFDAWRSYLVERRVNQKLTSRLGTPAWPFRLTLAHRRMPACDGTEDLKVYFGVETDEVRAARRQFVSPLAFAQRVSFDVRSGWGKGFLWVQSSGRHSVGFPQWSAQSQLRAILLHEIGHVAGCGHVSGTIMDAGIIDIMREARASASGEGTLFAATIDGSRALVVEKEKNIPEKLIPTDGKLLIRGLREFDRQPGEAVVFKMAFEPASDPISHVASLSSETVSYVGNAMYENGPLRRVLVQHNSPSARWRVFWWNETSGDLEHFRDFSELFTIR